MRRWLISIFLIAVFLTGCGLNPFGRDKDLGVRRSGNAGNSWEEANRVGDSAPLAGYAVNDIVFNPTRPDQVFIGTDEHGVYKSQDGGQSWEATPLALVEVDIEALAIDPVTPRTMYAAGAALEKGRLFKSVDGGEEWEEVFLEAVGSVALTAVTVDPRAHNKVYLANGNGQLLVSQDFGRSWKSLYDFDDFIWKVVIDPYNSQAIYVVLSDKGLARSTDGGANFVELTEAFNDFADAEKARNLALDPTDTAVLYHGSDYGLLVSRDFGSSWQAQPTVIEEKSLPIRAIAVNPRNGQEIFIAAAGTVYRSINGGEHWSVNNIQSDSVVSCIAINPADPKVILVGLAKGESQGFRPIGM